MAKKTSPKSKRIPEFASIEEEAAFWDTHSTADYEAEFMPVRVRFAKRLSSGVTIRLDPDTLKQLRTMAQEKGIGPTTLIRMWVLERLRNTVAHRGNTYSGTEN
jgi:predicted DNA binding CopG/RHH family protein